MTTQPNRRSALKSVAALAAGLFAAPAVKAARSKSAAELELERWEEIVRRPRYCERDCRSSAGPALALLAEVADAADAVLQSHECDDACRAHPAYEDECIWLDDLEGVKFLAETFYIMLEGEASASVGEAVQAEAARRREAADRRAHHGCPVLWCWRALCLRGRGPGRALDGHAGPDSWLTGYARRQWGAVVHDRRHAGRGPPARKQRGGPPGLHGGRLTRGEDAGPGPHGRGRGLPSGCRRVIAAPQPARPRPGSFPPLPPRPRPIRTSAATPRRNDPSLGTTTRRQIMSDAPKRLSLREAARRGAEANRREREARAILEGTPSAPPTPPPAGEGEPSRTEQVQAKCGHPVPFTLYPTGKDKFREARRKHVADRDCPECRQKAHEARTAAEMTAARQRRGDKAKREAPVGTVCRTARASTGWSGTRKRGNGPGR